MAAHPQAAKLRLTDHLPRKPGVYLFRDGGGRTLYVGKATDLRARVRSYFSGDDRRKVGQLLREVERIDHVVCPSPLEAAVLEVRLIHRLEPRFNRQSTTWRRYCYLKLTDEAFPRLSVVRAIRDDGALYLGPLPSNKAAKRVAEAIETAVPLRRCTGSPGKGGARTGAVRARPARRRHLPVRRRHHRGRPTPRSSPPSGAACWRSRRILLGPLEAKMHALAVRGAVRGGGRHARPGRRPRRGPARASAASTRCAGPAGWWWRSTGARGPSCSAAAWCAPGPSPSRASPPCPLPLDLDPAAPDHLRRPCPDDATAPGAPAAQGARRRAGLRRPVARPARATASGSSTPTAPLAPAGPPLPSFEPPVAFRR